MALCGRADLARMLREKEKDAFLAGLLGYEAPLAGIDQPPAKREIELAPSPAEPAAGLETPPPQIAWAPLPFFYAATFEPYHDEVETTQTSPEKRALTRVDLAERRLVPGASAPKPPLLAPWPRLQRQVAGLLQEQVQSRTIDTEALLRHLSRGRLPRALPFHRHKRWPRRLHLVLDRSCRLTPFWHDQDEVLHRLRRRLGSSQVLEFRIYDGMETPIPLGAARRKNISLTSSASVLVLGDCGCLGSYAPLLQQWRRLGRNLLAGGAAPKVLLPAHPGRWRPQHLSEWQMAPWEASRGAAAGRRPAWLAERALRLLTLASPAVRVEPGLLRTLRRLLPEARNDAGAEADVWRHPHVSSGSSVALTISPKALNILRAGFAALAPALREQALLILRRWRESLPREIWYEEVLSLEPQDQHLFAAEIALAQEEFLRIAATIQKHGDAVIGNEIEQRIIAWFWRFHPRTADREGLWRASPELSTALHQAEAIVFRDQPLMPTAIGFDPRFIGAPGRECVWTVRQIGDALHIAEKSAPAATNAGSPLALLPSTRDIVQHLAGAPEVSVVEQGFKAVLYLEPATGKLIEGRLVKPAWANAFGQDQYGIWAVFRYGEVEQRLRYLPPGRFTMGSPKNEAGRWDDEIPHQVTLTHGYWLFDTPVIQALWTAVMKKNPSRFQSPKRPVENVSWEECQTFIEKINRQIPGLDLRLPTEAEWEYACRAGATTATYAGDLEIKGERNAPILDGIAWYGGNSGVEFELKDGWDTSDWKEMQYPRKKAGTHPVAQKAPNAWGLYDMLGNVWEWCSDWYGEYSGKDEIDPTGPKVGADRVDRGGSWISNARRVRAADRGLWHPDDRLGHLGFRCARGQGEPGRQKQARGGAETAPAERAGERTAEVPDRAKKRKKK